jgi:hypothetical protein
MVRRLEVRLEKQPQMLESIKVIMMEIQRILLRQNIILRWLGDATDKKQFVRLEIPIAVLVKYYLLSGVL